MGNCLTESQPKREVARDTFERVQAKNEKPRQIQPQERDQTNHQKQRHTEVFPNNPIKDLEKTQNQSQVDQLFQHPSNPHRNMFQVTSTLTGRKIAFVYPSDTNCYNCIKKESIPIDSVIGFKIKQTKTLRQHIYYGIATQAIITSPSSWSEMVVFSSRSGQIWENGSWKSKGNKLKDGETLVVYVDTRKWMIDWKAGDSKGCSSQIVQKMRHKMLYLVITMHDKNDMVELLY